MPIVEERFGLSCLGTKHAAGSRSWYHRPRNREKEKIIPKRFEDPVVVPPVVLEGLEAVRASGAVNLADLPVVQDVAAIMGYPETVLWIQEHPDEYSEGLFRGFVAAE